MWNPSSTESIDHEPPAIDPDRDALEQEEDDQLPGGGVLVQIAPWAVSALIHAALVLLTVWSIWWTVAQTNDQVIMIPNTKFSDKPGTPFKFKKLSKALRPSPKRRSVAGSRSRRYTLGKTVASTNPWKPRAMSSVLWNNNSLLTEVGLDDPFKSHFFYRRGNARRLAYVIDASGSLIDTLPFVIHELKRSIGNLSEMQLFTVVFFMGGKAVEIPPGGLRYADYNIKLQTYRWIEPSSGNIVPQGRTNPLPAIKRALGYKPQLMYLLSDNITGSGQFELNNEFVLAEIRAEMKRVGATTKINTIQFLYPDPLTKIGMKPTMQIIAEETGGIYKFVDRRMIGLE